MSKIRRSKGPRRLVVGLTGGIACGKSTVARHFEKLGALVLCADSLAGEELAAGRAGYKAVTRRYGKDALSEDGSLNRAFVARRVFADARELEWLEGVLHPLVLKKAAAAIKAGRGVIVFDVPLLFEKRLGDMFDVTVAVYAGERERIARAVARGWTAAEFAARESAQLPPESKLEMADIAIDNSGEKSKTFQAVERAYRAFLALVQES